MVTCAKTVHRFCYKIDVNLFANEGRDEVAFAMTSLPEQTTITAVCWLDECNVAIGADNGAMIAVNIGMSHSILSSTAPSFHEVSLKDHHSATTPLQWVWGGLGLDKMDDRQQAILAMVPVPDDGMMPTHDVPHVNDMKIDTYILTLSADYVLRLWSYKQQKCLVRQTIATELGIRMDSHHNHRSSRAEDHVHGIFAIRAQMSMIVQDLNAHEHEHSPPYERRILLHVTSSPQSYNNVNNHDHYNHNDIVMLRGDISPQALDVDVARRFMVDVHKPTTTTTTSSSSASLPSPSSSAATILQLVDFVVDGTNLYSVWRSSEVEDLVVVYPLAWTGPKIVLGHVVRRSRMTQVGGGFGLKERTGTWDLTEELEEEEEEGTEIMAIQSNSREMTLQELDVRQRLDTKKMNWHLRLIYAYDDPYFDGHTLYLDVFQ